MQLCERDKIDIWRPQCLSATMVAKSLTATPPSAASSKTTTHRKTKLSPLIGCINRATDLITAHGFKLWIFSQHAPEYGASFRGQRSNSRVDQVLHVFFFQCPVREVRSNQSGHERFATHLDQSRRTPLERRQRTSKSDGTDLGCFIAHKRCQFYHFYQ